jgi:hypothetical protein
MLELRLARHILAEVARQVRLGPQVDRPPAQQLGELRLHASERYVPRRLAGFELHEQIDIAVRALLTPEDGAEQ